MRKAGYQFRGPPDFLLGVDSSQFTFNSVGTPPRPDLTNQQSTFGHITDHTVATSHQPFSTAARCQREKWGANLAAAEVVLGIAFAATEGFLNVSRAESKYETASSLNTHPAVHQSSKVRRALLRIGALLLNADPPHSYPIPDREGSN